MSNPQPSPLGRSLCGGLTATVGVCFQDLDFPRSRDARRILATAPA